MKGIAWKCWIDPRFLVRFMELGDYMRIAIYNNGIGLKRNVYFLMQVGY